MMDWLHFRLQTAYLNMILNERNEARNEGRKEGDKIAHKKGVCFSFIAKIFT